MTSPAPRPSSQAPEATVPETDAPETPAPQADASPEAAPQTDAASEATPGTQAAPDANTAPDAEQGKTAGKGKAKAKSKPAPPEPAEIVRRIGDTSEQALAYVLDPDPRLSRLSRKVREHLLTELPPVTAAALLGPAALARHFIASASAGRYRDLFHLWELFRTRPDECKAELSERPKALEKGRHALLTAVRLGLAGHADRVAEDVALAQGLVWQWLREPLVADLAAVGHRPAVAAALLRREPDLDVPLPEEPDADWLAEAAAARADGPLPEAIDARLGANLDRLPATPATLALAHDSYPQRIPALLERVDLDAPDVGAVLAWARDHGHGQTLHTRIERDVREAALRERAEGLSRWQAWQDRGIDVALPESLAEGSLEGLDLTRPETAVLVARLVERGTVTDPQALVDGVAGENRQLGEKAYEAFVCAGLPVRLPAGLRENPIVKEGTRCPACEAWTWVRPGHEKRCTREALGDGAAISEPQPSVSATAEAVDPVDEWSAAADASAADASAADASAADAAAGAGE